MAISDLGVRRDVRRVAIVADERDPIALPLEEDEVGRARRLAGEDEERGSALDGADRQPDVRLGLVARDVAPHAGTAARRLRHEIEAALVGQKLAQRFPVARVEQRHVALEQRALGVVEGGRRTRRRRQRAQRPAAPHQRRLDRRDGGVHRLGGLGQRTAQHVLEDDGAALAHRQRQEARQRRPHHGRVGGRLRLGHGVVEIRPALDPAVLVAAQEVDGRVVRDAKQPGAQRRRLDLHPDGVERLGQRVLHHVLAVDRRADQARAVAVQGRAKLADQGEEALARLAELRRDRPILAHGRRGRLTPPLSPASSAAARGPCWPPGPSPARGCRAWRSARSRSRSDRGSRSSR